MTRIIGSVGRGGRNETNDVRVVQQLLTSRRIDTGQIDGRCGPRTISAIWRFQGMFMRQPDGRVDPRGATLRRLVASGPVDPVEVITKSVGAEKDFTSLTSVPAGINAGLVAVSNSYMKEKFGNPRETYSQDCQPMTNATLKRHVSTKSVGPFRVTGLTPAVDSLAVVLANVKAEKPSLYDALGSAGMMCCRNQRGSSTAISNHSWGTAIDLTLDGILDRYGDGSVQYGLTLLAPYFNAAGWYWGAAFRKEDSMHFEASRRLTDSWALSLRP